MELNPSAERRINFWRGGGERGRVVRGGVNFLTLGSSEISGFALGFTLPREPSSLLL